MKLLDIVLVSLAIVSFIIGVYESFFYGIETSYGFFMVSLALLFFRNFRKMNKEQNTDNN